MAENALEQIEWEKKKNQPDPNSKDPKEANAAKAREQAKKEQQSRLKKATF